MALLGVDAISSKQPAPLSSPVHIWPDMLPPPKSMHMHILIVAFSGMCPTKLIDSLVWNLNPMSETESWAQKLNRLKDDAYKLDGESQALCLREIAKLEMLSATTMRWTCRAALLDHLTETLRGRSVDTTRLEERLTDLSRSGSWLASEAHGALHRASNKQWLRLLADVQRKARDERTT